MRTKHGQINRRPQNVADAGDILEPHGSEGRTSADGARRYRKPLTSLRWSDIQGVLEQSLTEWSKHKAPRLGASLAFYALLCITPLMLLAVSIVGLMFGPEIVQQVDQLVGSAGAKGLQAILEGSRNRTHGITAIVFGLFTLLLGASGVLVELRDALNTIWEVPTPPVIGNWQRVTCFIKARLFSFALVLASGFVLLISLAVNAWIAALGPVSGNFLSTNEVLLHFLTSAVSFVLITGLSAAIFKVMPDVRIEWRDVILGAAVTSLFFTVGKLLIGLYLGKASFASTYGAAGSIVVFILWVYYSGQIFFFGAEFTRVFANRYGSCAGEDRAGRFRPHDRRGGMPIPKL